MPEAAQQVAIILTSGNSDGGKKATLALSCALAARALGHEVAVFLTSDGAAWGYNGSTTGIHIEGFSPMARLMDQFLGANGRLILCSACEKTCGNKPTAYEDQLELLPQVEIGGFTTVIEFAMGGLAITF